MIQPPFPSQVMVASLLLAGLAQAGTGAGLGPAATLASVEVDGNHWVALRFLAPEDSQWSFDARIETAGASTFRLATHYGVDGDYDYYGGGVVGASSARDAHVVVRAGPLGTLMEEHSAEASTGRARAWADQDGLGAEYVAVAIFAANGPLRGTATLQGTAGVALLGQADGPAWFLRDVDGFQGEWRALAYNPQALPVPGWGYGAKAQVLAQADLAVEGRLFSDYHVASNTGAAAAAVESAAGWVPLEPQCTLGCDLHHTFHEAPPGRYRFHLLAQADAHAPLARVPDAWLVAADVAVP